MLKNLVLKNFRKHEDRTFEFTPGLNILRGENEQGKSTVYEAIGYAMFGSTALRESLEDVVTYDKPIGTLRVQLAVEMDGVTYAVSRAKSGAEITYADQRVTGQTETRKFFESLLGCSADTFTMLALAAQGSVRGVLAKGATATNGLVETLAQLGVVEDIIDKIQTQLPSGNTSAIQKQIEATEVGDEPVKPVLLDTTGISSRLHEIAQKIGSANECLPSANKLAIAEVALKKAGEASRDRQKQEERNISLRAGLKAPVDPGITETDVAAARDAVANSAEDERKRKAYKMKFEGSAESWDGSVESLKEEIRKVDKEWQDNNVKINELSANIKLARKSTVSGTTCPTCKRELEDAAAIQEHNKQHEYDIALWEHELDYAQTFAADKKQERTTLQTVLACHENNVRSLSEYWEMDTSVGIPAKITWKGEPPPEAKPLPDVAAMDKQLQDYRRRCLAHEQTLATLAEPLPEVPDVSEEAELMAQAEATRKELQALEADKRASEKELTTAQHANELAMAAYSMAVTSYRSKVEAKKQLKEALAEMVKHNELIKKLRGARPAIATKLWGTVLGAVSHYTSSIRGETSMITKDAEGFKINGRNVEGLSGSGQDALGLAIRIALAKMFLPALPFVMLDEVFSAADNSRETNGLGTLAGAGFQQTILVTHSDLGDSLADNLIEL